MRPARHTLRLTEIKLAVGKYEFSIAPRLMFATDGTMLHGSLNSTLIDILEKLDTGRNIEGYTKEDLHASSYRDNSLHRRSDFNGKRVQAREKMDRIKTCSYLADHLTILFHRAHIIEKYLSKLLVVKPRTGYSLRSDSETLLVIPKVTRKTFGDRAFFHAGPTVWNALPSSLRNCRNIDSFKVQLKTFLRKLLICNFINLLLLLFLSIYCIYIFIFLYIL